MKKFLMVLMIALIPLTAKATFLVTSKPTMVAWPTPQISQTWFVTGTNTFWIYAGASTFIQFASTNGVADGPITFSLTSGSMFFNSSNGNEPYLDSDGNWNMDNADVSNVSNFKGLTYQVGATPTPGYMLTPGAVYGPPLVNNGIITGIANTATPTISPTPTNTPGMSPTVVIAGYNPSSTKNLYNFGLGWDTTEQTIYSSAASIGIGNVANTWAQIIVTSAGSITFTNPNNSNVYFDNGGSLNMSANNINMGGGVIYGGYGPVSQITNMVAQTYYGGATPTPGFTGAVTVDAGIAATPVVLHFAGGILCVSTPQP